MENISKLITIKQLPIIEQMLDNMSSDIDKKIDMAMNLVPENSERELAETKKIRAQLNKDLAELENVRKNVKTEIMAPYLEFECIYKEKISDKFKEADKFFKGKIDSIESKIKETRKSGLKEYFDEYCLSTGVNCLQFEDLPIKINISGSDKSYRNKIKEFVDKVKQDLSVIDTAKDEQTRLEILLDYKRDFNVNRAILDHDKKERELEKLKNDNQVDNSLQKETLSTPVTEVDNTVYTMEFKVHGTKEQLKALKQYLIDNKLI